MPRRVRWRRGWEARAESLYWVSHAQHVAQSSHRARANFLDGRFGCLLVICSAIGNAFDFTPLVSPDQPYAPRCARAILEFVRGRGALVASTKMGPPSLQRSSRRHLAILRTQEGWMIRVSLPPFMIKAVAVVALHFYTSHLSTKVMRLHFVLK